MMNSSALVQMFLWLICVQCCLVHVGATILAASKINSCILDGSQEAALLNCKKKMVVTIAIDSGQVPRLSFSIIQLNLHSVQNYTETIEATLETAVDEQGNLKRLLHPI